MNERDSFALTVAERVGEANGQKWEVAEIHRGCMPCTAGFVGRLSSSQWPLASHLSPIHFVFIYSSATLLFSLSELSVLSIEFQWHTVSELQRWLWLLGVTSGNWIWAVCKELCTNTLACRRTQLFAQWRSTSLVHSGELQEPGGRRVDHIHNTPMFWH